MRYILAMLVAAGVIGILYGFMRFMIGRKRLWMDSGLPVPGVWKVLITINDFLVLNVVWLVALLVVGALVTAAILPKRSGAAGS